MVELCSHWHTKEHITYLEGSDDEYAYTLKTTTNVCVHCLQIMRQYTRRVGFVTINSKNDLIRIYNLKADAESYAELIGGRWAEAEIAGVLGATNN